ncbi:MAG: F0F1 ATP synthase subunit gamma [Magnetospirillum sp.]|nr:F0F1 ATP synthase subunit gamma [Magnetospirillum sp.]
MERLERIQARIRNLGQLLDVVGAMRSMAAFRLQQAVAALAGARAYAAIMAEAMAEAEELADRHAAPEARPGMAGVLVFGSEHGFVGAFNETLMAEAGRPAPARLFVVGARGAAFAEEAGLASEWSLPMTGRIDGVATLGRRLAERLYPLFGGGGLGSLDVIHGTVGEGLRWRPRRTRLLPLEPARRPAGRRRPFPPIHTLPAETLIGHLKGQYLVADLVCAATEALAAENAARLAATGGAHENVERRLGELRLREGLLRQEAVTGELLDVITGAEMLLGKTERH